MTDRRIPKDRLTSELTRLSELLKTQKQSERQIRQRCDDLEHSNGLLLAEIERLKQSRDEILRDRDELERNVDTRTIELKEINTRLRLEVADREKAEDSLGESAKRYQLLVQNANDFIYQTDIHGCFTLVNPVGLRVTGYSQEEIIGKHFLDVVHPEYREWVGRFYRAQYENSVLGTYLEVPVVTLQGETVWFGLNVHLVMDGDKGVGFQAICRDITERKLAEERLRESEERYKKLYEEAKKAEQIYRSLLNASVDAIVIYDMSGAVRYVSPSFTRIFGWTIHQLEGRKVPFVPVAEREAIDALIDLVGQGGKPVSGFESRRYTKDGRILDVNISVSRYDDHHGEPSGIMVVLSDITDRKTAERDLEAALANSVQLRAAAEAASRAKGEFLANMSHELRTPLNAILGFSEILEDQIFGQLNPEQQKYVRMVLASGHHLLQLINNILDLAKVESGTMGLRAAAVNLERLTKECLLMIEEKAAKRKLKLALHLAEDEAQARICGDELKLKQIIFNLLSNAVKFTPEGGSIDLEAYKEGENLRVSVTDTGVGIKPGDRERIFSAFEQVDSSYARREQGTGLGLALTRRLVELHGGRIWVESQGAGKGSRFTFVIPWQEALQCHSEGPSLQGVIRNAGPAKKKLGGLNDIGQ